MIQNKNREIRKIQHILFPFFVFKLDSLDSKREIVKNNFQGTQNIFIFHRLFYKTINLSETDSNIFKLKLENNELDENLKQRLILCWWAQ